MKKLAIYLFLILFCRAGLDATANNAINRHQVVERNNPHISAVDTLAPLSVGNGTFAYTVDITGLQTFPVHYRLGVPLGTQSQWGWHSFPNTENYKLEETFEEYDLGRRRLESYPIVSSQDKRHRDAANFLRADAHRLHLGIVGYEITDDKQRTVGSDAVSGIDQVLDLWKGIISSRFQVFGKQVTTETICHPGKDMIAAKVSSALFKEGKLKIKLHFPYPTGRNTDDPCDWNAPGKHITQITEQGDGYAVLERILDDTKYYVRVNWTGKAKLNKKEDHYFVLVPESADLDFSVLFSSEKPDRSSETFGQTIAESSKHWENYWQNGGFIDLGESKDSRAKELERRIILSQYLMAIQCAGEVPPQETGLTYNSWYGKFHLEMHWWHGVHFALWNRTELLEKSLDWYSTVLEEAEKTAKRQGFEGVRWMKMTDLSGTESPSDVGPFLIWQQPHLIYMTELIYRQRQSPEIIEKYKDIVFKTADFMASFVTFDEENDRYMLKGLIAAQEVMKASETYNTPFELSYWHYGLSVAQQWRERAGLGRNEKWDDIINKLSVLAAKDGLYLAAESAPETYSDIRYTSDHMSVLGAFGILPENRLFEKPVMKNTLDWVMKNWNWDRTWGWDFPMTAMCAARLGEPEKAVDALLMDQRTNTYLPNGHNYQNSILRIYLPGNGGLLTTVAMMAAGWDGSQGDTPGFPKNGNWVVKYEGINRMP
ncbi:MAG: hypothetical protein LBH77_06780 [Tannerella sp.]|jgi:hypothetical protein|nr:hypothetical protein [Tannerella sp.]